MKCADPVVVLEKSTGKRLYRNFSFVKKNTLFLENAQAVYNCGKCIFCRKRKAYELAARCVMHSTLYQDNSFVTLTYDEKKEGYENTQDYTQIQKFKKKLRSHVRRSGGGQIEVFNVHEYGRNGKKHWHLIAFGYRPMDCVLYTMSQGNPLYTAESLEKLWGYGFVTIGDVSEASAMYQAQYMEKDFKHGYQGSSKASHSMHRGIGAPYFKRHYDQILRLGYVPFNGQKMPIPRTFLKIAEKHHAHFYAPDKFYDTLTRKQKFRPFWSSRSQEEPNIAIADLYGRYATYKQEFVRQLEKKWDDFLAERSPGSTPEFFQAAENYIHDLKQRNSKGAF